MPLDSPACIAEFEAGSRVFLATPKAVPRKTSGLRVLMRFHDKLAEFVTTNAPENAVLVVNLSGVRFLSSAVLGRLAAIDDLLKRKGGTLHVAGTNPRTTEAFQVIGLDLVVHIHPGRSGPDVARRILLDQSSRAESTAAPPAVSRQTPDSRDGEGLPHPRISA